MATAAPQRNQESGWSKVPNSLIENQHLFTPAEFSFAVIVLRKGGAGSPVPVTDRNWQLWTGQSARTKEYAIKGLRSKGLDVVGRGHDAKFQFNRQTWDSFVKVHSGQQRPQHTAGRPIGVKPKPGAKIHPACAENGCAVMQAEKSPPPQNGLSLILPASLAQLVAQTPAKIKASTKANSTPPQKWLSPLSAAPLAQPVAQTPRVPEQIERGWPKTLSEIRAAFPAAGGALLGSLFAALTAELQKGLSDEELARAVVSAWTAKRSKQKTPGLFLHTVPEYLAALRRVPEAKLGQLARQFVELLEAARRALESGHWSFAPFATRVGELAAELKISGDLFGVEDRAQRLAGEISDHGFSQFPMQECLEIQSRVKETLDSFGPLSALDRELLTAEFLEREVLERLKLPRLHVFHTS